jgi:hypothetical protein
VGYNRYEQKEGNVSGRAKVFVIIAAIAFAMPVAAQAPTTAFDGKYAGLSADVSKSTAHGRQCPRESVPDLLTIKNGAVRSKGRDRWKGTVNQQGGLVIRNKRSMRVDAQIDPQGNISGQYNGPACMVVYVWRKQPV